MQKYVRIFCLPFLVFKSIIREKSGIKIFPGVMLDETGTFKSR